MDEKNLFFLETVPLDGIYLMKFLIFRIKGGKQRLNLFKVLSGASKNKIK